MFLHADIQFKSAVGISEGVLSINFTSFGAFGNHVLTLGYEEDELFAFIFLFANVVTCLNVFKLEAIDYPLDVFLAEPIEHF